MCLVTVRAVKPRACWKPKQVVSQVCLSGQKRNHMTPRGERGGNGDMNGDMNGDRNGDRNGD